LAHQKSQNTGNQGSADNPKDVFNQLGFDYFTAYFVGIEILNGFEGFAD
jgi:hypothetical protein